MKLLKTIQRSETTGTEIKELFNEYSVIHVESAVPAEESYWTAQAQSIGELIVMDEDKNTGNKTGNFWIDIRYDPAYPNHFIHANCRQPLHTDGSYEAHAPNISFFYCIKEADIGGATTFIDVETVKACLLLENPELLLRLENEPLKFSKGEDSKTSLVFFENKCNWNYFRAEKCELAEEFHAYLENRIINMGILYGVRLKPGEALFFQDNNVLHGRNAFIGNRWLRKGGINWTKQ